MDLFVLTRDLDLKGQKLIIRSHVTEKYGSPVSRSVVVLLKTKLDLHEGMNVCEAHWNSCQYVSKNVMFYIPQCLSEHCI